LVDRGNWGKGERDNEGFGGRGAGKGEKSNDVGLTTPKTCGSVHYAGYFHGKCSVRKNGKGQKGGEGWAEWKKAKRGKMEQSINARFVRKKGTRWGAGGLIFGEKNEGGGVERIENLQQFKRKKTGGSGKKKKNQHYLGKR